MSTKGRRWREGHAKLAKLTSLAGLAGRGEHAARRVVEAYKLQGDQLREWIASSRWISSVRGLVRGLPLRSSVTCSRSPW